MLCLCGLILAVFTFLSFGSFLFLEFIVFASSLDYFIQLHINLNHALLYLSCILVLYSMYLTNPYTDYAWMQCVLPLEMHLAIYRIRWKVHCVYFYLFTVFCVYLILLLFYVCSIAKSQVFHLLIHFIRNFISKIYLSNQISHNISITT